MKIRLASIDRRSMSTQLTQYFERYAENAIAQMKEALIAVGYYERIRQRLLKNEDLSAE